MELALVWVSQSPAQVLLGGVETRHDGNKAHQKADQPTAADQTQMSGDGRLGLSSASEKKAEVV